MYFFYPDSLEVIDQTFFHNQLNVWYRKKSRLGGFL